MTGPAPPPIISAEGLTYTYHPGTSLEKKALKDLSIQVQKGECVGIVGEAGSGKSTLLQLLAGLLRPSAGHVRLDGMDLGRPGIPWAEVRRRAALLFQYPEHQLFEETVFADISFALRQRKTVPAEETERRVRVACALVGLDYDAFQGRSPFELSGGEMRRTALAGILAQDPDIFIFDEPTVGLDTPSRKEILREIGELHRQGGTVVLVAHEIEDLVPLVDRLIVLEEGMLLTAGRPADVFTFLLQAGKMDFLVPPVFRLARELQDRGAVLPENLFQVEEAVEALDRWLRSRPCGSPAVQ